jgi:hypothetical protein
MGKSKMYSVPQNWKIIFWVGGISKFHAGAGIKQNQRLLPFPRTTKMNVLGHHYFAKKHHKTSQIKFKPALHSLSQGFGLSGGHPTFGDEPLTPIRQTFFLFDCFVSPPTRISLDGRAHQTTFGSITTSYLRPRNFRQP